MGSDEIKTFHENDAGYEAWVARRGGYVLTVRGAGSYMVHISECGHLGRDTVALRLTEKPRRWAQKRQTLIDWAVAEAGVGPAFCGTCM
jgi:hypothetical protein